MLTLVSSISFAPSDVQLCGDVWWRHCGLWQMCFLIDWRMKVKPPPSGMTPAESCQVFAGVCDLIGPQPDRESQRDTKWLVVSPLSSGSECLSAPVTSASLHAVPGEPRLPAPRGGCSQVTWRMNTSVSPKVWPRALSCSSDTSLPVCPSPLMSRPPLCGADSFLLCHWLLCSHV